MDSTKKYRKIIASLLAVTLILLAGCKVSYKLTGASIDYTKVKTISLEPFQNRAAYQWGPMAQMFNQTLNDVFVQQTKLVQVKNGGDLHFAGEITSYDQFNKSISSDGYSSMVQLKMTVMCVLPTIPITTRTLSGASRQCAILRHRSRSNRYRKSL